MTPTRHGVCVFHDKEPRKVRAKMERVSSYGGWTPRAHLKSSSSYFFAPPHAPHCYGSARRR